MARYGHFSFRTFIVYLLVRHDHFFELESSLKSFFVKLNKTV